MGRIEFKDGFELCTTRVRQRELVRWRVMTFLGVLSNTYVVEEDIREQQGRISQELHKHKKWIGNECMLFFYFFDDENDE